MPAWTIDGDCDPKLTPVRDAFAANFEAGLEVGASFAVTIDGRSVVDLWGGHADAARTRPWQRDTIVNVYSTTKAMTALCAHVLADRGLLNVDEPVARYWPEFAQNDKAAVTPRMLLAHTAGLAGVSRPLSVEDLYAWDPMVDALAAEEPWWEPGTQSGYHAITFGHLIGELVRRISGKTPGRFFREEIAAPLSADFQIGLPAADDRRAAELVAAAANETAAPDPSSMLGRIVNNPRMTPSLGNTIEWRRAELPAVNGHGNARSVARVMSMLACNGKAGDVSLLQPQTVESAITEQIHGPDLVLGMPMRWGLGFMLASSTLPIGPNPRTFGHGGWGGSLGFADLDARVSFAYVMNRMSPGTTGDLRAAGPIAALYGCI